MKFRLVGSVRWAVGSCHDDRSMMIKEQIDAPNKKAAIEKARVLIQTLHKAYSFRTDYALSAELHDGAKPVWRTRFCDEEPARPYVPAQKARPAVAAHFEEKRLS